MSVSRIKSHEWIIREDETDIHIIIEEPSYHDYVTRIPKSRGEEFARELAGCIVREHNEALKAKVAHAF